MRTFEPTLRYRRVRDEYARVGHRLEQLAQRFERLKAARLDPVRDELEALEIQLAAMERMLAESRPRVATVARGIAAWRTISDPRLPRPVGSAPNGVHETLEKELARLREDLRRHTAQLHAAGRRADRMPRLFRRLAEGLFFAVRYLDGEREKHDGAGEGQGSKR